MYVCICIHKYSMYFATFIIKYMYAHTHSVKQASIHTWCDVKLLTSNRGLLMEPSSSSFSLAFHDSVSFHKRIRSPSTCGRTLKHRINHLLTASMLLYYRLNGKVGTFQESLVLEMHDSLNFKHQTLLEDTYFSI